MTSKDETSAAADTPQSRIGRALAGAAELKGLEQVPAAALPSISMPMHLSLDTVSCPVRFAGSTLAVLAKAYHAGILAPYTFAAAVEATRRAGEAGVAPRLVASSEKEQVIATELLDAGWRMAIASDVRKPEIKAAVLDVKKTWHRQEKLATTVSPFDVARDYASRLEPHFASIPFKGGIPFPQVLQWIARIEEALLAAGSDVSPVHGENTVSNVLVGPGDRIALVDFDRATNGDPLHDVGALCLDVCRNDRERMETVEMYVGRMDPAVLARVKLYGLVDDFVWGCWALLAEADPALRGPEWFKYASNRFVRLTYHLQSFDMQDLLASA